MRNLATPGVTIEEIASFPPSVAPVATAIPAFVGHVQNAVAPDGSTNLGVSKRLASLLEFETIYGRPSAQALNLMVTKREGPGNALIGVDVSFAPAPAVQPEAVPAQPRLLYHAMQLYFANGGGPCYVHAIDTAGVDAAAFNTAFVAIEAVDEVTLLVFPDALNLGNINYGTVVNSALQSCERTQDRFAISDVPNAYALAAAPVITNTDVTDEFRARVPAVSEDFLKYGAAYFPFLNTSLPRLVDEGAVTMVQEAQVIALNAAGVAQPATPLIDTDASAAFDEAVLLNSPELQGDATVLPVLPGEKAVVDAIRSFLRESFVTMPPSAAIAGVYARVDRTNGVHVAPANKGVFNVIGPAAPITNDLNGQLNLDPGSGKSVNVIRNFTGKGTLVWGARTLAGNSNDNRYVPVRRFLNFAEESIEKAVGAFVFAPNDANTWVRVRTMIENFLTNQWRAGALVGPKPEAAFNVRVGLNQTMTNEDILNGLMIVRVGLAIVRPAEFIVLQFEQIQQQA